MPFSPEEQRNIDEWNATHAVVETDLVMQSYMRPWFENCRSLLKRNMKLHDISELIAIYNDIEGFIIAGSGPSLLDIAPSLRASRFPIIASPTALGTLLAEGVDPDILMIADKHDDLYYIVEALKPANIRNYSVVLAPTCSSLFWDEQSIFKPEQLYFYLPFASDRGTIETPLNDIFRALFLPEIHSFLAQVGSASNVALEFAEWACGPIDESKRIHIAVDNCWWTGENGLPPRYRSPFAHRNADGSYSLYDPPPSRTVNADRPSFHVGPVMTDSTMLGYAIQMVELIRQYASTHATKAERYVLHHESAHLYEAALPGLFNRANWPHELLISLLKIATDHTERKERQ